MGKPFAWSWSVLTSFETCPHRHYRTKVVKDVAEPQSEEMLWGNRVHKGLELRVRDHTPLPETLKAYEPIAQKILTAGQGGYIETEQKLGLDRNYEPTGFFSKDIYCRVITDVTVVKGSKALVLDYKTGNKQPGSAQLRLCAGATFAQNPAIQEVRTGYLWLKHNGEVTAETYVRSDLASIWQHFLPRVSKLERAVEEDRWPVNPSGLCRRHCPVRDCAHNGMR